MYRKINGKYIKQNGSLSELKYSNLQFTVRGPSFLNWLYVPTDPNSPPIAGRPNGYLLLRSSKPNNVTINFGDGTVTTYPFILLSAGRYAFYMKSQIGYPPASAEFNSANYDNHIFTDGNTTNDRIVNLSVQYPEYITEVATTVVLLRNKFPADIDKFKLVALTTNYATYLNTFPDNITNVKTLETLSIVAPSQTKLTTFPDSFLGLTNLKTLNISGVFDFADPIASGLYKLGSYGSQLLTLGIAASRIGATETNLPIEFLNLTGLNQITIDANSFERVPDRIGQMPWLRVLGLGGFGTENVLADWGDFSTLTELTTLFCNVLQALPTSLPTWFNSLVKLKTFSLAGTYHTQIRQDTFVDNMYTFVTTNAAITGANTLPFRGMLINIYLASAPSQSPRPTGIFQQPSGYVAGVSNGTPASQMEKIWVMINQYGHTWTVNPS